MTTLDHLRELLGKAEPGSVRVILQPIGYPHDWLLLKFLDGDWRCIPPAEFATLKAAYPQKFKATN